MRVASQEEGKNRNPGCRRNDFNRRNYYVLGFCVFFWRKVFGGEKDENYLIYDIKCCHISYPKWKVSICPIFISTFGRVTVLSPGIVGPQTCELTHWDFFSVTHCSWNVVNNAKAFLWKYAKVSKTTLGSGKQIGGIIINWLINTTSHNMSDLSSNSRFYFCHILTTPQASVIWQVPLF